MQKDKTVSSKFSGLTLEKELTTSASTSVISREEVKNTPFEMIKTEEGYFLVWGQFLISKTTKTKKACLKQLDEEFWNILSVFVLSLVSKSKEIDLINKK